MTDLRSPNGGLRNGADLTGTTDFVTIYTLVAQDTGDFGATNSAKRNSFRLREMIEQLANLNYIKVSSAVVDLSDSVTRAFYGMGSDYNQASTTMYTVKFAVGMPGFVDATKIAALVQGVTAVFSTVSVPITGPSTRTISAYETISSSTKNFVASVVTI